MTARILIVCMLAASSSACLTASVRIRGGPTLGTDGDVGWELGVAAGIGYSGSPSTSVRSLPGVTTSDRGTSFGTSLEVGAVGEPVSWYAGVSAEGASTGSELVASAYGATMYPLWFARRYSSEGKFTLIAHRRTSLALGVEARAGNAHDRDSDADRGLFALLPVLDLTATLFD